MKRRTVIGRRKSKSASFFTSWHDFIAALASNMDLHDLDKSEDLVSLHKKCRRSLR